MRKITTLILLLFFYQLVFSQSDIQDTIHSNILKDSRYLNIHIPKSYNDSITKKYSLIITLDSENIYYFTVGNTEIFYDSDPDFQIIPETIIVGIKQNYEYKDTENLIRGRDSNYDINTGLLTKNSINFKNFIYQELIPFINSNYRTNGFTAIIGHSLTATFVSNLLLEDNNMINAFVSISPNIPKDLAEKIHSKNYSTPKIYYNSTGTFDLRDHKSSTEKFNENYNEKDRFFYQYEFFENENHVSLINRSLPNAIKHIFCLFKPSNEETIKKLIKSNDKLSFLKNFAINSKKIYGQETVITNYDFLEYYYYIENNIKDYWPLYKEIADIHLLILPGTESYYALGKYEEEYKKDYVKALKYYEDGFKLIEPEVSNKESFKKDIERVKAKINIKK